MTVSFNLAELKLSVTKFFSINKNTVSSRITIVGLLSGFHCSSKAVYFEALEKLICDMGEWI